jgi:hypothetical protein
MQAHKDDGHQPIKMKAKNVVVVVAIFNYITAQYQ